jgi:ZIP family zinc transporter
LVGFLLFGYIFNELALGITFGMVAGIMVFISLDQLLPASQKYGEHHLSIYGLMVGMVVMAASLLLFI